MQTDPVEEWRRLGALYSEMGDLEIRELFNQINDLTPAAQNVLREELKKRGLPNGSEEGPATPVPSTHRATVNWEPASYRNQSGSVLDGEEGSVHYTWKVPLCDCETTVEARRVAVMLQRAGIDSWIEASTKHYGPRILVGADQLDQAQVVATRPIAQDILDEERELENAPEYENPTCPECGAPDPTLESVEPSNNWLCESCDHAWSDPVSDKSFREIDPDA